MTFPNLISSLHDSPISEAVCRKSNKGTVTYHGVQFQINTPSICCLHARKTSKFAVTQTAKAQLSWLQRYCGTFLPGSSKPLRRLQVSCKSWGIFIYSTWIPEVHHHVLNYPRDIQRCQSFEFVGDECLNHSFGLTMKTYRTLIIRQSRHLASVQTQTYTCTCNECLHYKLKPSHSLRS